MGQVGWCWHTRGNIRQHDNRRSRRARLGARSLLLEAVEVAEARIKLLVASDC